MNITLSADQQLIDEARRYAKKQNTSLNNLIRGYLQAIGSEKDRASKADEFAKLAKQFSGKSPEGFRFNRESIYDRPEKE